MKSTSLTIPALGEAETVHTEADAPIVNIAGASTVVTSQVGTGVGVAVGGTGVGVGVDPDAVYVMTSWGDREGEKLKLLANFRPYAPPVPLRIKDKLLPDCHPGWLIIS